MSPRFNEALAIPTPKESQAGIPDAEASSVQALSDEGSLRHAMRGRLRHLVSGRFLGMYDLSHVIDTKLELSRRRDAETDAADAEFPPVEKVATAIRPEGLKHVGGYHESSLIVTHSRQDLADLAAAVSAEYGEVQVEYPNKFCEDFFSSTMTHYTRGIQSSLTVTDTITMQDGPKVSPVVEFMDSNDLEFSSDDSWQPFIVEAAPNVESDINSPDFLKLHPADRIKRRNRARLMGERGMTPELAAHLTLQSAVEDEPLNEEQFIILDGVPVVAGRYVAIAHNYKGIPTVEWIPNNRTKGARFRGRILKVLRGTPIKVK